MRERQLWCRWNLETNEKMSLQSQAKIHQSQKTIKKTELGYETSIRVIPNFELYKLILSFGERIKILTPEAVVNRMKLITKELNKLYSI